MQTTSSCSTTTLSARKRSSLMGENCRLLLAQCHLKKCGVENLVSLEGNIKKKKILRENYVVCLVI